MFLEFVDRKQRESKRHLKLLERMLRKNGMQVLSHIEDEEPYIFVKSPKKLSFDGIRIYEIGDVIAYRVQKQEKTHPFGKSYMIDMDQMFGDFMSENMEEEQAGKEVIKSVINEIKKFFTHSAEAEKELIDTRQDGPGLIIKTGGSDYSSHVVNRV